MTIADRLGTRNNNFDAIRLLAALAVILAHAYPLTGHTGEPLTRLTRDQIDSGAAAVDVFFIISGFLITQSYLRRPGLGSYARARSLRIVPGLVVALFFCAFVVGPLMTTVPLRSYLSDAQTYRFFLSPAIGGQEFSSLPGVFAHNPFPNDVNGLLWTLEIEATCYVVVAILGVLGLLRAEAVGFLLAVSVIQPFVHGLPLGYPWLTWIDFFRYFAAGALLFLLARRIPFRGDLALFCAVVLVASAWSGRGLNTLAVFLGAYIVV